MGVVVLFSKMTRRGIACLLVAAFAQACAPGAARLNGRGLSDLPQTYADMEISAADQARGHFLVSLVAADEGDNQRATREMQLAVSLDPDEPLLRERLLHLYIRSGQLDMALAQASLLADIAPDDFKNQVLVADLLVSLARYEEAIEQHVLLLVEHPDNVEVLVQLGALYNRTGNYEEAVAVLEKATFYDPDSAIAISYLGRSYALSGDFERASVSYRRATELGPVSDQVYLEMGYVYTRLELTEQAIESYQRALDFNPDLLAARRELGKLYVSQGQLDQALQQYEDLMPREVDPVDTQVKIGLISLRRGDYDRARTEFELALAARPDDGRVRYYLANTYLQEGDTREAERQLRRIPTDSAHFAQGSMDLAHVLVASERISDAIEVLGAVVKVDRDNVDALRFLVSLYSSSHDYQRALKAARVLVDAYPGNDSYLYLEALVNDEMGRREEANRLLRQVLEINPENGMALNHLGYTFADSGENLDEAEDLIRRALVVYPNDGAILDSLGWVYYQKGDYESAVVELERAMELIGHDPVVREHLADAYVKVGRMAEARRAYRDSAARGKDHDLVERVRGKLRDLEKQLSATPPEL